MPTTKITGRYPNKTRAAAHATTVRVRKMRNRRFRRYLAEIRSEGYTVIVSDHDGEVSFDEA